MPVERRETYKEAKERRKKEAQKIQDDMYGKNFKPYGVTFVNPPDIDTGGNKRFDRMKSRRGQNDTNRNPKASGRG